MHYAMLDRAESGETRLTIHLYGHTIDHMECGSPYILLRVRESNRLRSHTYAARSVNNAPQLHTSRLLHIITVKYNNNSEAK